jgi:hypothetical protein
MVIFEQKGKLPGDIIFIRGSSKYWKEQHSWELTLIYQEEGIMFKIKGPILAAMDLDKRSD